MKFAVLVFCINSLEVTSMVFSSIEKGLDKVEELTGKKMEKVVSDDGKVSYELNVYDEMNDDSDFSEKFFTAYYPGCGDASYMVLKEVEEGQPFCEWDLD